MIHDSAPATSAPATGAPASPAPADSTQWMAPDAALLTVHVPADAKVYVNDRLTKSTGVLRQFVSRGLAAGSQYKYEVRVELPRGGQTLTETRTITLVGGGDGTLAFNFSDDDNQVAQK